MRSIHIPLIAALVAFAGWSVNPALADDKDDDKEEMVAFADLPAEVQATFLKESGAEKIDQVEKETEDGEVVYEAEVDIDGKKYEIEVNAEGTLLCKKLESHDDDDEKNDKD